MHIVKTEFDPQAPEALADDAGTDEVPAFWGCECALPFLIPSLQAAAAGRPLQR